MKKVNQYLRDVKSGKPIAEIPRSYILRVHEAFLVKKDNLFLSKNKIDQILQDFVNVEQRLNLIKRNKKPEKFEITREKPEDCYKELLDQLIKGEPLEIIPEESTKPLIDYCRKRVEQHIQNDELLLADNINNLLENLIKFSYDKYNIGSLCGKKEEIQIQINNLNIQIEETENKLKYELENHDHETFLSLEHEEEEWAKTQLNFDMETDKGPSPKFRKLSGKLLNMREIEKSLISSKRLKEAIDLKQVNDKLEKEELSIMEEAFLQERAVKKEQLRFHHQQTIECIKIKSERYKHKIIKKREIEIENLKNALRNLMNKELETDKQINNAEHPKSLLQGIMKCNDLSSPKIQS